MYGLLFYNAVWMLFPALLLAIVNGQLELVGGVPW